MIHIQPDRCGYNGYECVGLHELKQPYIGYRFTHTRYSCLEEPTQWIEHADVSDSDSSYNRFGIYGGMRYGGYATGVDGDFDKTLIRVADDLEQDESSSMSNIDNYLNLPVNIRGIVMSVNYIPDMDTVPVEGEDDSDSSVYRAIVPPEAGCEENSDVSDSYCTFMNVYSDVSKVAVYVDDQLHPQGQAVAGDYKPVTDSSEAGRQLPGFPTEHHIMEPGILDVMLNNSFDPVDLDLGPALGFDIDGLLIAILGINKWRIRITKVINHYISLISGLANAQGAACDDIRIFQKNDHYYTNDHNQVFDIEIDNITVNGKNLLNSTLKTTHNGAFHAYVKLVFDGASTTNLNGYATVTPSIVYSKSSTNDQTVYISIGGVTRTSVAGKYLYRVTQDRCRIDVDLVRTEAGGIVVRGGFGGKNAGGGSHSGSPFGIAETGDCDEEE